MTQRREARRLQDFRCLAEVLQAAYHDSGLPLETVAERMHLSRPSYLAEAMNPHRDETQFQARSIIPFCQSVYSVLPVAWLADQLGYVLVKREQAAEADTIVRETLDVAASAGRLSQRVREATMDGRLCAVEQGDIVSEARRVQRDAAEVERAAELMAVQPVRRPA